MKNIPYIKVQIATMLAILLWSTSYTLISIALEDYSPGSLALFRFLTASMAIGIVYIIASPFKQKIAYHDYPPMLLLGATGMGLYSLLINYGEQTVSSSIASFIIAMMPIFVTILAALLLGEQISIKKILFMLLSLLGLGLIAWDGASGEGFGIGIVCLFISAMLGAIYLVGKKYFLKKYQTIQVVSCSIWGGTLPLLFYLTNLLNELPTASWKSNIAVLYLGIFPFVIGFLAFSYALSYKSANELSIYFYTIPIFSSILGWWLIGEQFTPITLIGEATTLLGVFFVERENKKT